MKKVKQIAAWIAVIVIVGLVIATFVLGILGSQLTLAMLVLTMGVSITLWVLLWFLGILAKRSDKKEDQQEKGQE